MQLDPFAHSGGVTTFEGLLMGVPTVTLRGDRVVSRLSASFLTLLGLDGLVAETLDQYVAIATGLAEQRDWLACQRPPSASACWPPRSPTSNSTPSPSRPPTAPSGTATVVSPSLWDGVEVRALLQKANISSEAAW